MTEIYFVRHGQTAQNAAKRFQGHSDTDLDETGRSQARRVAARLAHENPAAIYSSDLTRAVQTAEPIAKALQLTVKPREDLREINVGDATGMSKAELQEHLPAMFAEGWHHVKFPNGESYDDTAQRVSGATRKIAAAHPGQKVIIVTHGGSIRCAVIGLLGIPVKALEGLFVFNTSITRIAFDGNGRARMLGLNDAAHLETWAQERSTNP